MKSILVILLLASSSLNAICANAWQSDNGDGTYTNPPLYADYPDPDIIRVGDDFYIATTTFVNSPGLRILHSKDLVNWEIISNVIPRLEGKAEYDMLGGVAYRNGVFAPSLRYHEGTYYVVVTPVGQNTRIYSTKDPCGPWNSTVLDREAFDPGFFIDSDGAGYIFTSGGWDGTVTLLTLNDNFTAVVDSKRIYFNRGAEGSKIVKRGEWYYLFNSIPSRLALTVSRAKKLEGPWETREQINDATGGHQGALVDLPDGSWYGFVMKDFKGVGRMTNISPVYWENDWPVWGTPDHPNRVPSVAEKPIKGYPIMQPETSSEFDSANLGLQWAWNHNPLQDCWSLTERPGYLRLKPTKSEGFWTARNTLTQKGQGPWSQGEIKIDINNLKPGDTCGFGTLGKFSAHIAVSCDKNGKLSLGMDVLEDTVDGIKTDTRVEAVPINTKSIYLRTTLDFETNIGTCAYSLDNTNWEILGGDFPLMFDWRTGTFQGPQYAIFCYNPAVSEGYVDVDYFRFTDTNPISKLEMASFNNFEYTGKNPSSNIDELAAGDYSNPILAGFYPDPSICRVGDDYYLINSTFAYFPGIPIFHSKDLVNWEQIGHVIHRLGQLSYENLGVSEGIFAPAISYHDGKFYVICTMVGAEGNFVVTATDPAGPWSDPTILRFEGIDPSIFFDDDGQAWVVNNGAPEGAPLYDGHRAIWIQKFDLIEKKMIGPRKVLINGGVDISTKPIWIEGPHLYKTNGWYYLSCAEGGTGPQHSQVVLRSKNVDGPYVAWEKNPILTQRDLNPSMAGAVTCTGHSDFVLGPEGNWWVVFLGVRPYENGRFSPMGRETFLLPVTWTEDGWPLILPPNERVPVTGKSPGGAVVKASTSIPLNGSFTWRDDFTNETLSPLWIMLREPKETWWAINIHKGSLELVPRAEKLSGRGNPSFLARRVQHNMFSASTELTIPKIEGVAAGLAVFQNDRHHYFLGVQKDGNQAVVFLEQANRQDQSILATKQIQDSDIVTLRVAVNQDRCSFDFKTQSGDWQRLVTDADAKLLTTDVAGGFVGATVGPYATLKDPIQLTENMDSYNKSIPHQFASTGENPIFRDVFTADPAPLVVGDTLYVYVGHDDARGDQMFNMPEWLCYSTKDMKNWTAHGPVLNPSDFDWSDGSNTAWAAQVVENNGKFYYYVTVMHDPKHGHSANAIGVAVSENPTGPFTDARGTALITDEMTPESKRWGEDIDPTVYIDDGTPWLCWGNSDCYIVKLKKNMIELDGSIVKIDLPNYTEGPWLHKRGEMYYLTYAMQLPGVVPEQIGYATAPAASGPWTYRGKVTGPAENSFTIHPGIVEFKDQWYFFYHNAALMLNGEGGALGRRSVCVEYLFYNPDGSIQPITQNIEGISLPPLKPQFLVSSSNESQE